MHIVCYSDLFDYNSFKGSFFTTLLVVCPCDSAAFLSNACCCFLRIMSASLKAYKIFLKSEQKIKTYVSIRLEVET